MQKHRQAAADLWLILYLNPQMEGELSAVASPFFVATGNVGTPDGGN